MGRDAGPGSQRGRQTKDRDRLVLSRQLRNGAPSELGRPLAHQTFKKEMSLSILGGGTEYSVRSIHRHSSPLPLLFVFGSWTLRGTPYYGVLRPLEQRSVLLALTITPFVPRGLALGSSLGIGSTCPSNYRDPNNYPNSLGSIPNCIVKLGPIV